MSEFYTTGMAGQVLYYRTKGIFNITSVSFAGADADYTESNGELRVKVPLNAAWGRIALGSEPRHITGYSKFLFAPKPLVLTPVPNAAMPGDSILIPGYGFSGVTDVYINNLPIDFAILSNTGISGVVPSGNVNGLVRVIGQSGIFGLSDENFQTCSLATGTVPSSGWAADYVQILGVNFIESALLDLNPPYGEYLISFNGTTGIATRINDTRLDTTVPIGASSGPVHVYNPRMSIDGTMADFTVIPDAPAISSISPTSGTIGDQVSVYGLNFSGANVELSGALQPVDDLIVSTLGNALYFKLPSGLDTGNYVLVVSTIGGVDSTGFDVV